MIEVPVGVAVMCTDGPCGESTAVVINPITREVTHVAVKVEAEEYLVPLDRVAESSASEIRLDCTRSEVRSMDPFAETHYVPPTSADYTAYYGGEWQSPYSTTTMTTDYVLAVDELIPAGELAVHRGDPVEATDGHVGYVEEFLVEEESHAVTHLVIAEAHPWGKRLISVPIGQIDRQDELGVVQLKLDKAGVRALPGVPIKRHYKADKSAGEPQLMAYVFEGADKAAEVSGSLENQTEALGIHSMAILMRDREGRTSLHDSADISKGKSRVVGGLIGGLTGLLAGPVGAILGAVAGAGVGNLTAKHVDLGLSNEFLSGLQEHLANDTSALVVVVDQGQANHLSGQLAGAKGVILQETLTPEALEHLVISDENVADSDTS